MSWTWRALRPLSVRRRVVGTDLDDEMAMLFARYLIEFNFIELLAVISCLHPSFKRAQLARGTMDMIGLHSVPVAFGTDGGDVHVHAGV